jgi:hypothetical protein
MGDWCGSILPHNQHKEKTGANRKCKKEPSFERKKGQAKNMAFFLHGEVFFLLTHPLMGDPFRNLRLLTILAGAAGRLDP